MTLFLGILIASVVGSLHCAAMCGPLACLAAGRGRNGAAFGSHVAYHAGRLISYAMLGAAAGAIGAQVNDLGALPSGRSGCSAARSSGWARSRP